MNFYHTDRKMSLVKLLALFCASISLLLPSCGLSKYGPQETVWNLDTISDKDLIKLVNKQNPWPNHLRSVVRATLTREGGEEISTKLDLAASGELGIRLVIIPFPMVEAGRVWINTEGVMGSITFGGKRAITAPWSVLSDAAGLPLNYCMLRKLLMGVVADPSSFVCLGGSLSSGCDTKVFRQGRHVKVSVRNEGTLYTWQIGCNGRPESLIVDDGIEGEYVRWDYENYFFAQYVGYVPQDHYITVYRHNRPQATLRLQFGRMRFDRFEPSILMPRVESPILLNNPHELSRMFSIK